jgi:ligand-binding sensor domain-containing protein
MSDLIQYSQESFRHADWRTYTPADGLPGLHIGQIEQDADGFLWFISAHGGVSRFDGERFEPIRHLGARIVRMHRDRRHRLWFAGTDGAMALYEDGRFVSCDVLEQIGGFTQQILEDRQGRIWFWGAGTLSWTDGEQVCDLLPWYEERFGRAWRYCWGIAEDAEGHIWLGGDRLIHFDGEVFHECGPEQGVPGQELPYVVGQGADGEIWFAGDDQIMRYDGRHFEGVAQLSGGAPRALHRDPGNRLWCLTTAAAWCLANDRLICVGREDGLKVPLTDICVDREGLIWFASWGLGVTCCDSVAIQHFEHDDFEKVDDLLSDRRDRLLIGTSTGIACWSKGEISSWPNNDHQFTARLVIDGAGHLWRGGLEGLQRWDPEHEAVVADYGIEEFPRITAMAADAQGRLVFSHDNPEQDALCITRRESDSFVELLRQPKRGAAGGSFNRLLPAPNGDLWLGLGGWDGLTGDGAGLGRLDHHGKVSWYRPAEGLVDDRVEDLCYDDEERLWIATRGGISCLSGSQFTNYTMAEGLPVESVLSVCQDRHGILWFGSEDAVVRYDGELFQIVRAPDIRGSVKRIVEDVSGQLWFSTAAGIVAYTPGDVAPVARIVRVIADRTYDASEQIELSGDHVLFEFKGLSTRTAVGDLLYRYRLVGHDDRWVSTRQQQATFHDLPTGNYVFEVTATDRDHNESTPAALDLQVVTDLRILGLAEASGGGVVEFVGASKALRQLQSELAEVAPTDLTVLILGETGTGKGLAARMVHALSRQNGGPLIQVNCGALPESLVESELFGHEKGAFTSAVSRKLGRVELASGGTLFLDEIGDMSLSAQVKLLRLLEEKTFERVGGIQTFDADCRVVAATNRDLSEMVETGLFRQDLFYRLQVFPVRIPPLRERRDDIALLALYFAERMAQHLRKPISSIHRAAVEAMREYDWPGNVRELEHAVQRAVIVCRGDQIRIQDLSLDIAATRELTADPVLPLAEQEHRHISDVLRRVAYSGDVVHPVRRKPSTRSGPFRPLVGA